MNNNILRLRLRLRQINRWRRRHIWRQRQIQRQRYRQKNICRCRQGTDADRNVDTDIPADIDSDSGAYVDVDAHGNRNEGGNRGEDEVIYGSGYIGGDWGCTHKYINSGEGVIYGLESCGIDVSATTRSVTVTLELATLENFPIILIPDIPRISSHMWLPSRCTRSKPLYYLHT